MRVEPHCFQVYLWERCEESLKFYHEVVVWRDDVKEVFDDADVVVCPSLVCGRIYPGAGHSGHIVWNNGVDFIPEAVYTHQSMTVKHSRNFQTPSRKT